MTGWKLRPKEAKGFVQVNTIRRQKEMLLWFKPGPIEEGTLETMNR